MASRPACPYPCAGSGCPHIRTDAECIACDARPMLDAWYQAVADWDAAEQDRTGSSHPYYSPALAGWGGGDR